MFSTRLEDMLIMMFMTTILPTIVKTITNLIRDSIPDIKNMFRQFWLWIKDEKSITISQTLRFNKKIGIWVVDACEPDNGAGIVSILEYLEQNHMNKIKCANYNITTRIDDDKRIPILQALPKSIVTCEGVTIQYGNEITDDKKVVIITMTSNNLESIRTFISKRVNTYYADNYNSNKDIGKIRFFKHCMTKEKTERSYFAKYIMNTKTTFDSIFFPQKNQLIKQADKLASGELYKLTLLLHGEPGCGKTSIIKSLAKHLSYDIIEIKLSQVTNDSELVDYFHEAHVKTKYRNSPGSRIIIFMCRRTNESTYLRTSMRIPISCSSARMMKTRTKKQAHVPPRKHCSLR